MGNYWLTIDTIKSLIEDLNILFEPYIDSYFESSEDLLKDMTDLQVDFLNRNMHYRNYIQWIKITYLSTKFRKDEDEEVWRFDGYEIVSLYT
ncbi:MAG: hypothetical protein DWQ19_11555 [Crenarchaeota archaeon]|nr:MAG: hypothetical protein DWQ19_11555 [Thermoproteota archaeon]